jgi:orotidine-5'-phosphate decarboxylase
MNEKIIIALDFDTFFEAKNLINLIPEAVFFKVGLIPFLAYGEEIIAYLQQQHKKLFLDLKFKDIPNTVAGAVRASHKFQPGFLTIHLSGGAEMIRQAVAAAKENSDLTVLGVTVLTSMSEDDLADIGCNLSVTENVVKLCALGINNGLNSFVCSPQEISVLKSRFGNQIHLITPGIRPVASAKDDQKRVFTPKMAMDAGSDYLVIGRPITAAQNPRQAFLDILAEVRS